MVFSICANAVIYINNIVDLQKIGNDPNYPLNGNYELTQDIDASDTINWNSGAGFSPIGNSTTPFAGKFDGKGYKITNFNINRPSMDYIGLFGAIDSPGKVQNLFIVNGYAKGNNYVGILCGSHKGGEIYNCGAQGSAIASLDYAGGLIGIMIGNGSVYRCYAEGSVTGINSVGGLVGSLNLNCIVENSYSDCVVTGNNYVGGLSGYNSAQSFVFRCYSLGSVSGSTMVGGLLGWNDGGVVNQTYSTGFVSGSTYKGGLIGRNSGTVTNSYWDTQTSGQSSSAGGTGKTTAEMKQEATFVDWDFVNVWGIVENTTYPYLKWQYTVPDVVGMTQSNAEEAITGAGLTVGTVTQQCSDTVSAGNVISQNPTAGTQVSPGSAVNLVVSSGLCTVLVPNVVSLGLDVAENIITGAGLDVGIVTWECHESVPNGHVINQEPMGGIEIIIGGKVNLIVSTGRCIEGTPEGVVEGTPEGAVEGTPEGAVEGTPEGEGEGSGELVAVPDVKNMSQVDATNELIRVGLIVGNLSQRCDDKIPQGKVASQTPSAGTQVNRGSAVDLIISTGPCPVLVPDVVGRTETQARGAIEAAGLQLVITYECSDNISVNNVIRQNPLAGTGVNAGSSVTIWVSTGPCPVESLDMRLRSYSGVDHVYVVWEGSVDRNLAGYRLYRSTKESGPWQSVTGATELITDTSYRDYGIEINKVYWYKLDMLKQDGSVMTVGPVQVEPGKIELWVPELEWNAEDKKEIYVPVNIGNALGLSPYTMDIDLSYDSNVLVAQRVEKTAVSAGMQVWYNVKQSGLVQIGALPPVDRGQDILRGEGHLFDVVFTLKSGVVNEASSEIVFVENDLYDKNEQKILVSVRKGKVVVRRNCMRGDMTNDGKIQSVDALNLLRRVVTRDWKTSDELSCLLKRGDMNGDGILDVADVSMLMRWSTGLKINPDQINVTGSKSFMKVIGSDTQVNVIGGSPSGSQLSNYEVNIELSSLGGLAGVDLVLSYSSGLSYTGSVLGEKLNNFKKDETSGDGYIRLSLSNDKAITEDVPGRILTVKFNVASVTGDKKEERKVQIREVRLKGEFGDDFRWYGDVKRTDGIITVCPPVKDMQGMSYEQATQWLIGAGYLPDKREESRLDVSVGSVIGTEPGSGAILSAGSKVVVIVSKGGTKEQLVEALKISYGEADANGDGLVSWSEASSKYPGLTQEVFNQMDTNGDGSISKQEAGIVVSEGEGVGEETKKCGCGGKSMGDNLWWKYLLDFVLVGMLMFAMSGMRRRV